VEGQPWAPDGAPRDTPLRGLADRLQRGASQAPPVARGSIPKADGRQHPIGKLPLADNIGPRAPIEVLHAIDEPALLGCASGARPGRHPPHARDAVTVGRAKRNINGGRAADLRGVYDASDHGGLVPCVEHRSGDQRLVRQSRKWLKAGVLEDGPWRPQGEGTPQGESARPLLANLSLPSVLDLWAAPWRRRDARGDVISVRYGDDVIVGCQHQDDAAPFLSHLRARFHRLHLARPPDQTRLIAGGRGASARRQRRGQGQPATCSA
jgi:RNA-directed DNA polymerase